ncbi:MAG: hypothetical protein HC908_07655 [Calothrix sp. SM1_7_51]|nr:hypothetical protein [Calothrix sp. SM1_7_51]
MSIYQDSIQAFIKVIESQPQVISTEDWVELKQLTNKLSSSDEEILETIESWLQSQSRSQFLQAYEQQLELLSKRKFIGSFPWVGGIKFLTPPNQPSQSSKELLKNALVKNSPLSDNSNSNQKS